MSLDTPQLRCVCHGGGGGIYLGKTEAFGTNRVMVINGIFYAAINSMGS